MYELVSDSQEGSGGINTRDRNVSKNRLTHTRAHTHKSVQNALINENRKKKSVNYVTI